MTKVERIMQGQTVVVTDSELDTLCETVDNIRSLPNPHRVGTKDVWIAFITRYPSIAEE